MKPMLSIAYSYKHYMLHTEYIYIYIYVYRVYVSILFTCTKKVMFPVLFFLNVCLFVSTITKQLQARFSWNSVAWCSISQGKANYILELNHKVHTCNSFTSIEKVLAEVCNCFSISLLFGISFKPKYLFYSSSLGGFSLEIMKAISGLIRIHVDFKWTLTNFVTQIRSIESLPTILIVMT